mgnify:FL=1
MKWKSHRECTRAIAFDMGLPSEPMIEGCVYPDRVGMNMANKGNSVEGVNMDYPHHSGTDDRIRSLMLQLRKKVLNRDKIDPFVLGCLCHLIQDRAVYPYSDSRYQDFMDDVARFRIEYEWRRESLPLWDGRIVNNLSDMLTLDNPNNPVGALKEGYQKSLVVLRSILQNPYLPGDLQKRYAYCELVLRSHKKTRYAYWMFTYLNPLAPVHFVLDVNAIRSRDIVKRYGYIKKKTVLKGIILIFAAVFFYMAHYSFLGLWALLFSFAGIMITARFNVPEELITNLEWYLFPGEYTK